MSEVSVPIDSGIHAMRLYCAQRILRCGPLPRSVEYLVTHAEQSAAAAGGARRRAARARSAASFVRGSQVRTLRSGSS